jgi:hypothetical protein
MFSKLHYFHNLIPAPPKHHSFKSGNENLHPGNVILTNQRALFAPRFAIVPRFSRNAHSILL